MDFASLYPSIIKVKNLSYETVRCPHEECKTNAIPDTAHWACTKKNGITSLLIGSLRDLRVNYYKNLSNDQSLTEDQRQQYTVVSQALKVILNASYGVMGAELFPLYFLPAAEATTAVGRHIIVKTIEKCEDSGITVLYGDTDSLFIKNPTEEQIVKVIEEAKKDHGVDLEVDKEYRYVVLSDRKKNYLGVTKKGKVDIKGLTGKKSHTPTFIKTIFYELTDFYPKFVHKRSRRGAEKYRLPDDVDVIFYDEEKKLLEDAFALIREYPIVLTYNGDDFDMPYLYNRAKRLGIADADNPFHMLRDSATLNVGVHIDLYRTFSNRSFQIYAFSAKYSDFSLNSVTKALLNEEKIDYGVALDSLELNQLAHYCYNDARITLALTTFNNDVLMNLLIVIGRIGRMPIDDIARMGVSQWIRSLLYYEHRQRNALIPRRDELEKKIHGCEQYCRD